MTQVRPTFAQDHALRLAYSDAYVLYDFSDELDGVSASTLRSIKRRGWVEVDPNDPDGDTLCLTTGGRTALGLQGGLLRKPKRVRTALYKAIEHFLTEKSSVRHQGAVFRPKDLSAAVWVNDEQRADFGDALLLVHLDEADLLDFEALDWSCVARLVSELGFPCYTSKTRYIQAFWPDEVE